MADDFLYWCSLPDVLYLDKSNPSSYYQCRVKISVPLRPAQNVQVARSAMFARTFTVLLKSNTVADFNRALENEIIPILRKQRGFQDELTLVTPDG